MCFHHRLHTYSRHREQRLGVWNRQFRDGSSGLRYNNACCQRDRRSGLRLFRHKETFFPGSFGFADTLGGGLTINDFSSAAYSGSISAATNDQHFDGFGYVNDAGATTGPSAGSASALNSVSLDVSDGTSITDVNQLVNLANPAGGDGPAYFIVDAMNRNTTGPGAGNTGLLSVSDGDTPNTPVPEPTSLVLFSTALVGLRLIRGPRQVVPSAG